MAQCKQPLSVKVDSLNLGICSFASLYRVSNRSAGMISSRFPGNLPSRVANPGDYNDRVHPINR